MIASLLAGLPAWVLDVLDAAMILGALGGLTYIADRLIDHWWPANARPPAHLMRTADAKRIEDEVGALWGREATRVERVRAGDKLRPSYPKQPAPPAASTAARQYPHLVKSPASEP